MRPGRPERVGVAIPALDPLHPPAPPVSDDLGEVLVARAARGDLESFGRLYDDLAPRVLGLVTSIVDDVSLAEDTLRGVFLEVWHGARSFDPGRSTAAAWVMAIARRRALERARSSAASDTRQRRARLCEVGRPADVDDALTGLTDDQRRVVGLAYFAGCDRGEIAALTGLPDATVGSAARGALLQLRQQSPRSA